MPHFEMNTPLNNDFQAAYAIVSIGLDVMGRINICRLDAELREIRDLESEGPVAVAF